MKRFNLIVLVLVIALSGLVLVQAQETATPEPTVEPTVEPTQEPTAEPTVEVDVTEEPTVEPTEEPPVPAWVRVANWSPSAGAVDVSFDDAAVVTGLEYPNVTDYQPYDADTYSVTVSGIETPSEFTFASGAYRTVMVVGSAEGGTLNAVLAADDFSPIPFGSARIYAYHAVEGLGILDVFADGEVIVTELAYPGTFTDLSGNPNDGAFSVDIVAGTYDISFALTSDTAVTGLPTATPDGTTDETEDETGDETGDEADEDAAVDALISHPGMVLEAGRIYTIAAVGGADAPESFVTAMDGVVQPLPTLLEIAESSSNYSIFAAAVAAADPSIAETLSVEGQRTLFLPTNDAFDTFLSDMAMTTNDFFADADLLNSVLRHHILEGASFAENIVALNGQTLTTLQGEAIFIAVAEEGAVVLDGTTNVTATDMLASNGVVHVIDAVLVPVSIAGAEG